MNPTQNQKSKQFLLHMLYQLCYFCYKPSDKSWMRKGPDCDYDKWGICSYSWHITSKVLQSPPWIG
jgi:hypothetical protein